HHLNPSPSVPGAFHGFPVINLTEDSDDDLREIVPSQPPRQPRESAPVIDLTGLLDSPPEPQYRDGTTSRRARISRLPPWLASARSQARDAFPPPTRVGFTRDTCADPEEESENVAICPACCNELAYDPYDTMLHSPGNTSKRKRKRAPEGRRFWALKNCGYVYCADCYNTRKPAKIKRNGADSRALDERSPYLVAADFGCDVEDCNTRASTEDDWVAIYL
ncbi:hypothetical protein H9L39_17784, partial [Fusarium oxysporum f. sp. albedinis]